MFDSKQKSDSENLYSLLKTWGALFTLGLTVNYFLNTKMPEERKNKVKLETKKISVGEIMRNEEQARLNEEKARDSANRNTMIDNARKNAVKYLELSKQFTEQDFLESVQAHKKEDSLWFVKHPSSADQGEEYYEQAKTIYEQIRYNEMAGNAQSADSAFNKISKDISEYGFPGKFKIFSKEITGVHKIGKKIVYELKQQ